MKIEKDGVYQLNRSYFERNGIQVKDLDPGKIRLFTVREKLLDQSNLSVPDLQLIEIPVELKDSDGKFDKSDFIRFYAEGPHQILVDSSGNFSHQLHPFDSYSRVFVDLSGETPSMRIRESLKPAGDLTPLPGLTYFEYYEPEIANLLDSGREWLGEYFFSEWSKEFSIQGIVKGSSARITAQMVGQTYEDAELRILYKNKEIGKMLLPRITYRWNDNFRRYDRAGEIRKTDASFLVEGDNPEFTFQLPADLDISSGVRLDFLEITVEREPKHFTLQCSSYLFSSGIFSFKNDGLGYVWNVSEPLKPEVLSGNTANYEIGTTTGATRLAFFTDENVFEPQGITHFLQPAELAEEVPDLIIIYPELFKREALRLAEYRQRTDQLSVFTIGLEDVFYQFSGGKTDPTAIRNLCKYFWRKNPEKLKYLLLFGDTTFDPKNNNGLSFVKPEAYIPTYESRESLEPIFSYSSDDYFGFLEDHEGFWAEGFSERGIWRSNQDNDHTLDIAVGRLPVKNRIEASLLVDKLIYYGSSGGSLGDWKRNVLFTADDGDRNTHEKDAEAFSDLLELTNPSSRAVKVYVDAFPQIASATGEHVPQAVAKFEETLKRGVLVVNFNGHGSEDGWTDEKLLTIGQIQRWRNRDKMPVFVTATCEFGRFDNPSVVSGAELALLNPDGGAIALLTTTRPVFSSTNFPINSAFYKNLFETSSDGIRIGDVFRKTKNESVLGEINRNFSLLGDPSLRLIYPKDKILITSVNAGTPENAVVAYGSRISLSGELSDKSFNGKVKVTVFDKKSKKSTLGGAGNLRLNYEETDRKLFDGLTDLVDGKFAISLVLPTVKDTTEGTLYIYVYAVSSDSTREAIGSLHKVLIRGREIQETTDREAPKGELGYNLSEGLIEIVISDESGIFLPDGEENSMILVLNDTLEILPAGYLLMNETGKSGVIRYPVGQLPAGKYMLNLKVSDVYTNRASLTFEFTVGSRPFAIELLSLGPNPSDGILNAEVFQSATGENIEFEFRIFDHSGRLMREELKECFECENKVRIGTNLESYLHTNGRYIYHIRAKANHDKTESSVSGHLLFWK